MDTLLLVLLTPLAAALLIPAAGNLLRPRFWLLSLVPASLFVYFLTWLPEVKSEAAVQTLSWFPSLGVDLKLVLDGFSLMMCLLVTGIGFFILLYASGYLAKDKYIFRFYVLILIFMTSMLGIVLSGNLLLMFVFWEMTTISSYLLVGYKFEKENARKSALQALLITGIGGLVLLAGILILGLDYGGFEISVLKESVLAGEVKLAGKVGILLILIGCFTKSAQFPFHFWLPNAMEAPTPVSAYLHSATMVKAGVYLIYRLSDAFNGIAVWNGTLIVIGASTMLLAAVFGLFYQDLKKILAYSTVSVLGMLTLLAGIGSHLSMAAGMLVLVGHALYKATLFMVAGSIDHETGTRDVMKLRGLRKVMPFTFLGALLAAVSQAGLPPTLGFVGKEYFYKSSLASEFSILITSLVVMSSILIVFLAFSAGLHSFSGEQKEEYKNTHEAPFSMLAGPVILGFTGLLLGFFPMLISSSIIVPATIDLGFAYPSDIKLWHGFNAALFLSAVTALCGIFLYRCRQKVWAYTSGLLKVSGFRLDDTFARSVDHFLKFTKWITAIIQNGSLRSYLLMSIGGFMILLSITFFSLEEVPYMVDLQGVLPSELMLALIIAGAAFLSAFSSSLISALVSLGIIGFGMTIIFMMFGAPDLAITQVLVETLTVVMFMAVIYKLPAFKKYKERSKQSVDLVFSFACGLIVTLMILKSHALQLSNPVSETMGEISYLEAKGKNVVNVILVDFRALDTLGEITVLLIALIGGAILLKKSRSEGAA